MEESKKTWQKCQNEEINEKFSKLHSKLVNEIITFCKENNIEIDEFSLSADGVRESIKYGEWCPSTDSCFRFDESIYAEISRGRTNLTNVTKEEFENAKFNHKPFLISL